MPVTRISASMVTGTCEATSACSCGGQNGVQLEVAIVVSSRHLPDLQRRLSLPPPPIEVDMQTGLTLFVYAHYTKYTRPEHPSDFIAYNNRLIPTPYQRGFLEWRTLIEDCGPGRDIIRVDSACPNLQRQVSSPHMTWALETATSPSGSPRKCSTRSRRLQLSRA